MISNMLIISAIVLIIVVLIIIGVVLAVVLSNKKPQEPTSSILDVNDIGVSNSEQEFSYGYEKEETIVMDPVNEENLTANDDSTSNEEKNQN